jgi:hypothetical protein
MTPLALLVYSLATWRLASLLVCEDGPADAFKRLRQAACNVPFLRDLLGCVWCCSVWIGAGWMLADWIAPDLSIRLALMFAFSAAAVIVQRWMEVQEKGLA